MTEEREKLRQVAAVAKQRVGDKLGDLWWWFMIRGVLAVGLAMVALFWPQNTIEILVNLLGIYLLVDGIVGATGAVRSRGKDGFPVYAIASLIAGTILLFWTGISVRIFLVLVGVWAMLQGVSLFLASRSSDADARSRQSLAIVGGVMAVAGLILMVWPGTGVVAISWLIAAVALVAGCLLIFVALRLRRISRRMKVSE
jgi:uncharacterized membrane protein HdeD (DUF308 family)